MTDDRFDLPEWMLEKIREEYAAEMAALAEDPDSISISYGWHDDRLSLSIMIAGETINREVTSIKDLCDEPASGWHANGYTDAFHHKAIGDIAQRLKEQSDRLFAVQAGLKIRE